MPRSIGEFAHTASERWGNAAKNRENLISYQVCPEFDNAVLGVQLTTGEVVGIQGEKKRRKSTMMANFLLNFSRQLKGLWACVDSLESGMPPSTYSDFIMAMIATRIMIMQVYGQDRAVWPESQEICNNPELKPHLCLSPRNFMFLDKTKFQMDAINVSKTICNTLPISIFGPSSVDGHARDLDKSMERWDSLYCGEHPELPKKQHRIFVVDNIQQYTQYAGSSYGGLEIVTNALSNFVVTHPGAVVFAVSQVSMGTARTTPNQMEARGGTRLGEEVNLMLQPKYNEKEAPYYMEIYSPFSRGTPPPTIRQDVEPYSGVFLRPGRPVYHET